MNLCKDCLYFIADDDFPSCGHPSSKHRDPVTGKEKFYFCNLERLTDFGCGVEGKNWKPLS